MTRDQLTHDALRALLAEVSPVGRRQRRCRVADDPHRHVGVRLEHHRQTIETPYRFSCRLARLTLKLVTAQLEILTAILTGVEPFDDISADCALGRNYGSSVAKGDDTLHTWTRGRRRNQVGGAIVED